MYIKDFSDIDRENFRALIAGYRYYHKVAIAHIRNMKTLPFKRIPEKNDVQVECVEGWVSVYRKCAYCRHCSGVRVGKRVFPSPQKEKLTAVQRGMGVDEDLMNAQIMFNTYVRDGSAIECDDEGDEGFRSMYQF